MNNYGWLQRRKVQGWHYYVIIAGSADLMRGAGQGVTSTCMMVSDDDLVTLYLDPHITVWSRYSLETIAIMISIFLVIINFPCSL